MADGLVTITVRVPKSLTEQIKAAAERQERSFQAVVTRAIRLGLECEEEQERIAQVAIDAARTERRRQSGATDD